MLPRIRPMRLRLVRKPFDHPDYIFELKHDGFRPITYIQNGESRNSRALHRFRSLKAYLATLIGEAIIDGEIISLDTHSVSCFRELLSTKYTNEVVLYAFDLLWLNGTDVRRHPLLERKANLEKLVRKSGLRLMYAQHVEHYGKDFFAEICRRDLKGIVAKRKTGVYKDDGNSWLKIKNPKYSQTEGRHEMMTKSK